jgi:uncharacterized protein
MSLFDLTPKDSPSNLFGRDAELQELSRLVAARRWVVVLGPRMVGKTSLVKAAQTRLRQPGAYVNLWGVKSVQGLIEGLIAGLNATASLRARITRSLHRVEGVTAGPGGLTVSAPRRPLKTAWELLDLIGTETKSCVIVLDEIQEMSANSGGLLKLLGNLFNTRSNICFVFTGSLVGLSRTLLEPTAASPLYGRAPVPLVLKAFDRPTAERFLSRGAEELGARLGRAEIEHAVAGPLDGTPGWLTLFGNHVAVRRMDPARALSATIAEGKKVAESEVAHFLFGRDPSLYWPALKAMALGSSWSAVRSAISSQTGRRINDATVARIVHSLEASYIAHKDEDLYALTDPMVRAYVSGAGRAPHVS